MVLAFRVGINGGTRILHVTDEESRGAACRNCAEARRDELDEADRRKLSR